MYNSTAPDRNGGITGDLHATTVTVTPRVRPGVLDRVLASWDRLLERGL